MTLSDLSIRRPVFAWMLMAALITFGAISLGRLGVSDLPEIDFPVLTINLQWAGAAPEILETAIVDPIEEAVISAQGLRNITSFIEQGQASIILEFDLDRPIDAALTEIQSKVSSVKLPYDTTTQAATQTVQPVAQPILTKDNPEEQPILIVAVSGKDKTLHDLVTYVDLVLHDEFQIVPGVGEIVLAGYNVRNLRVWVNNEKLKPLQLTLLDVQTALQQEQVEVAAGYLENSRREMNVRAMGEGLTPEQVGNIQIKRRGTELVYRSPIHIKDVARVEDGLDDIRRIAVTDGHPVVGLGIKKQPGANSVAVARAVKQKLEEVKRRLPPGFEVKVVYDRTQHIEEAIQETLFTLLLSALVTAVVCYLFLGTWSSTLNVLLSIPTSVLGTFIALQTDADIVAPLSIRKLALGDTSDRNRHRIRDILNGHGAGIGCEPVGEDADLGHPVSKIGIEIDEVARLLHVARDLGNLLPEHLVVPAADRELDRKAPSRGESPDR